MEESKQFYRPNESPSPSNHPIYSTAPQEVQLRQLAIAIHNRFKCNPRLLIFSVSSFLSYIPWFFSASIAWVCFPLMHALLAILLAAYYERLEVRRSFEAGTAQTNVNKPVQDMKTTRSSVSSFPSRTMPVASWGWLCKRPDFHWSSFGATMLGLADDIEGNHIIDCTPLSILLLNLWLPILLAMALSRLQQIAYLSCGGLEGQLDSQYCGFAAEGSMYRGQLVERVIYHGGPFAGFAFAAEVTVPAIVVQQSIVFYFCFLAVLTISLIWEIHPAIKHQLVHRLKAVSNQSRVDDLEMRSINRVCVQEVVFQGDDDEHLDDQIVENPIHSRNSSMPYCRDDFGSANNTLAELTPFAQHKCNTEFARAQLCIKRLWGCRKPDTEIADEHLGRHKTNNEERFCVVDKFKRHYRIHQTCTWKTIATLASLAVALWAPFYSWIYYRHQTTVMDHVLLLFSSVIVFWTFALMWYPIQFPYLCYYRNYLMMLCLYYSPFDLTRLDQLRSWRELRSFYVDHKMPLTYGLAQWTFFSMFAIAISTVLAVVIRVLVQGSALLLYFGSQILLMGACLAMVFTYAMMHRAVSIWYMQRQHICLLQDLRLKCRIQRMVDSDATDKQLLLSGKQQTEGLVEFVDELIQYIESHDTAPQVFGISIKPTLFRVLQGYVIASVSAVLAKYILDK